MEPRYRVAVFGHTSRGNYGHQIDTAWLNVPSTEIVAVADPNETGRAEAASRLKVDRMFADYRQMLDEVKPDILAICPRWIDQHRDAAVAAAERGVHVFSEKPFCRSPAEADEIVMACERTHVRLAVAHPTRYSPLVGTLRRLIREGAIGDVIELRARGKEDHRGGGEDLWVLGSHMFDLMLALGYRPEWCFATVTHQGQPVGAADVVEGNEGLGPLAGDDIRAAYGMGRGVTATFQSQRGMGGTPTRYGLQIYGSRGVIEIVEGTLPAAFILQDPAWSPGRSGQSWQRVSSAGIGEPEPLTGPEYSHRNQLAIVDLLQAIAQQRDPLCNMYEARQVVEMTAAVFESQRIGRPVPFPLATRQNPLSLL